MNRKYILLPFNCIHSKQICKIIQIRHLVMTQPIYEFGSVFSDPSRNRPESETDTYRIRPEDRFAKGHGNDLVPARVSAIISPRGRHPKSNRSTSVMTRRPGEKKETPLWANASVAFIPLLAQFTPPRAFRSSVTSRGTSAFASCFH